MSDFAIRPMQPADEPFIFRAWLEGYWPHFPGNLILRKSEFMERWHRVIERILADPQTRTVVAHVEGKPEALLGFACGGPECMHWWYVKQPFRRLGISRAMLDAMVFERDEIVRTCHLPAISHWCRNPQYAYAPELLRRYT